MIILAIDTSSREGIVALQDSEGKISALKNSDQRAHNEFIMPAVDQLLKSAALSLLDIDYFAACVGPGSFVGTRLAVALTQGFAFGTNKPAVAISHLALIAEGWFDKDRNLDEITVRLDARMQGFYQGTFKRHQGLIGEERFQRFSGAPPEFTPFPIFTGESLITLAKRELNAGRVLHDPARLQPVYLQDEGNWKKII